jgi:hypothetical protein
MLDSVSSRSFELNFPPAAGSNASYESVLPIINQGIVISLYRYIGKSGYLIH